MRVTFSKIFMMCFAILGTFAIIRQGAPWWIIVIIAIVWLITLPFLFHVNDSSKTRWRRIKRGDYEQD